MAKSLGRCVLVCCFPLAAVAEPTLPIDICSREETRASCPASCAAACDERAFFKANLDYCLDARPVGADAAPALADEGRCAGLFAAASEGESGGASADALAAIGQAASRCASLERLSERVKCELQSEVPPCAETVRDLEENALLLVEEIDRELGQYGELLTRDWSDVRNRDLLCAFSREQLDDNYEIASDNPQILRGLQAKSKKMQACQNDWEGYLTRQASGSEAATSDTLDDDLIRTMREELDRLKPEMGKLTTSIDKLEQATETIEFVMIRHIQFCDPEGNGLQKPAPEPSE